MKMDDRDKKTGFALVDNFVIRDPGLTPEAKAIYSLLCSYADKDGLCFPSVVRLCSELNMTETRLRRHMRPLVEHGIIRKQQTRKGNIKQVNRYQIIDRIRKPGDIVSDGPKLEGPKVEASDFNQDSLYSRPVENRGTNNTIFNKPIINTNDNIEQLIEFVTNELNKHKARHSHKGRLKTGWEAHWTMKYLLSAGFSTDQIRQHAKDQPEYEDKKNPSFDWYSFLYSFPGIKRPKYYL